MLKLVLVIVSPFRVVVMSKVDVIDSVFVEAGRMLKLVVVSV
jgi:hypothetical protein